MCVCEERERSEPVAPTSIAGRCLLRPSRLTASRLSDAISGYLRAIISRAKIEV